MDPNKEHEWTIIEYQEAMASYRHYSNIRFAIFTLYATATAGLLYITIISRDERASTLIEILITLFGIYISYVAIDLEDRLAGYLKDISNFIKKEKLDGAHITNLHDAETDDVSQNFKNILLLLILIWVAILFSKAINLIL